MKAVALTRYLPISNPESLIDIELDKPAPTGRDLLVKIEAISVNPVDTKVRAPKDKVEETPRVLGWDAAGVVEAVGPDATLFRPGDPVYYAGSVTRQGANSEFHLVDERIVGAKPKSLDFTHAAALPLTTITAWEALFERLGVSPRGADEGKSVLVIGGAGGVGSIGIQLAKKVAKLTVIATASRPESAKWATELGADHIVNHFDDIPKQLKAIGFENVDYVLIFNDTDKHFPAAAEVIKPQGGICTIVENSRPLRSRVAEVEERRVSLGIHVHALDVRHARHDRTAQAAVGGGAADRRRHAHHYARPQPRQDRRGQPARGASAAGRRALDRQAGVDGVLKHASSCWSAGRGTGFP